MVITDEELRVKARILEEILTKYRPNIRVTAVQVTDVGIQFTIIAPYNKENDNE